MSIDACLFVIWLVVCILGFLLFMTIVRMTWLESRLDDLTKRVQESQQDENDGELEHLLTKVE